GLGVGRTGLVLTARVEQGAGENAARRRMTGPRRLEQQPRALLDAALTEAAVQVGEAERQHGTGIAVPHRWPQQFGALLRLSREALAAEKIEGAEAHAGSLVACSRRFLQ